MKLLITMFYASNLNNNLQPVLPFQRLARRRNYQHFLEIVRQNDKLRKHLSTLLSKVNVVGY